MKWIRYFFWFMVLFACIILGQHFFTKYQVAKDLSGDIRVPASDNLPPAELDEVWGPQQVREATFIAEDAVDTAKRNQKGNIMRRDAHPKHHGCVRAKLRIENSQLPEQYRVGLFSGLWKEKDAWVRFSNGDPGGALADDKTDDVRGMAIKVLDVPGTPNGNQDFVMMTSDKFFSKDNEDYLQLVKALGTSKLAVLSYFAMNPRNFKIVAGARVGYNNPLLINYHSAVPYKLGSTTMRFRLVPCSMGAANEVGLSFEGNNPMQEDLRRSVAAGESCFDFQVQPNQNLEDNPTEDPRRAWNENESPYYSIGALLINQDAQFGEYGNFCENIAFNPWNSLPQHRPMGQINRTRQMAYLAMSKFRHQFNGLQNLEPRDLQPCQNAETAAMCK